MPDNQQNDSKLSFSLLFEQWSPLGFALVGGFLLFVFSGGISGEFASGRWKSQGLYGAIFGWAAIQTGFAFAVYGFVVGKSDGFIAALRGTRAMRLFIGYIKRAIYSGFILTFATIPLIVTEPGLISGDSWGYRAVAVWFTIFLWSFLAFLRLAFNFGKIVSVPDKHFNGA
ncbi:hypothetical protein [Ensifer soli]|uniref:hypothetical protein n=1 Tax=Ciceribacter sp. sgz301302 TaxID=3342379 RepID=UPI0035B982BF